MTNIFWERFDCSSYWHKFHPQILFMWKHVEPSKKQKALSGLSPENKSKREIYLGDEDRILPADKRGAVRFAVVHETSFDVTMSIECVCLWQLKLLASFIKTDNKAFFVWRSLHVSSNYKTGEQAFVRYLPRIVKYELTSKPDADFVQITKLFMELMSNCLINLCSLKMFPFKSEAARRDDSWCRCTAEMVCTIVIILLIAAVTSYLFSVPKCQLA